MEEVSPYVHREKGVVMSPYVSIPEDPAVFEQTEIPALLEKEETIVWGIYDGKGTPIELTPADFFDMTLYLSADEVWINEEKDRGNTENNLKELFPNNTVIAYYNSGSDEYTSIDWSSILFVYEQDEQGLYYLVAIVRDVWTV